MFTTIGTYCILDNVGREIILKLPSGKVSSTCIILLMVLLVYFLMFGGHPEIGGKGCHFRLQFSSCG